MPILIKIISWAMSGAVGALLVGGGLTLVTAVGLNLAVEAVLDAGVTYFTSVPGDILQLALLSGVGEALSIVGAALATRATIMAASTFLGVKRA